jgi:glycosyltransferase involved in cell wall biosynthesis
VLFSVVICSYNRREHVVASVESALGQTLSSDLYEVIVVDNRSTDGTAEAIGALVDEHPNLRYIHEARLGLGTARNTGWQAAHGTYVAFLDDDARAETNWLETAQGLIARNPVNLRCVGGPIHPFYTSPAPDWWLDSYEIRTRGDVQRHLRQGESFSGSNMIWLKDVLELYGGFDESAGMKGTQLGMGEETALFRHVWEGEESPVFLYSPDLRVYHWVPPEKMTMGYILKRAAANGQFEADFALAHNADRVGRLRLVGATLRTLAVGVPTALLQRRHYRTTQNWYFEHCFTPIQNVSKLLRLLGITISVRQRHGQDAS